VICDDRGRGGGGRAERDVLVMETLMALQAAGCSGVLTYHAPLAARLMGG